MKEKLTPMLNQYLRIKKAYPDVILFFRLGDFYEMFFEDAKIASSVLHITLTSREAGRGRRIPMCGIPHHAAENYIARLLKEGYKVAICEQVEDPKLAKGVVKREVIRVITPGTLVGESIIQDNNNYILSLNEERGRFGISFCDISTGEFKTTELENQEEFLSEISRINPAEVLIPEGRNDLGKLLDIKTVTEYPDFYFIPESARDVLLSHFKVKTLAGFELDGRDLALSASGALLKYLEETQKRALTHIRKIEFYCVEKYMLLDSFTQRNLELVRSLEWERKEDSLLSVLDKTLTPMGKRLLQKWLLQPLLDIEEIKDRQDGVEFFYQDRFLRERAREILKGFQDLERIASKIGLDMANPRDVVNLRATLDKIERLKTLIPQIGPKIITGCQKMLAPLEELQEKIKKAIVEDPPVQINEGGIIKEGYSRELDELRKISSSGKEWIAQLQEREIKRTGITSLKVGYNKVFGYYIEVTKPNLKYVPPDYIRKQTLVNAERFITPELKEYEEKVLGAEEKIKELEKEIFISLREEIKNFISQLQSNANTVAVIDVLQSLAEAAEQNRYIRPKIHSGYEVIIKDGRHPVVERILPEGEFVPNDVVLNRDEKILIITGPNMAGKSTYIRQTALLIIMAQMGSFIPASSAEIGIVNRVFTRIGARDALVSGMSTFMVEMVEVARILNNADERSLIILDEVGRGTSTYDGLSIAWAVVEYIHKNIKAKTLFATHYHELTQIAKYLPEVKNLNVAVREYQGQVIFLYRVEEGSCDRSFGIHVAQLAGIPPEVIERAKQLLKELEKGRKIIARSPQIQYELFTPESKPHPVVEEIKKLDIERMSGIEALNFLHQLKKRLEEN
jgi:DNA mismatch repair protein MutS